MGKMDVHYSSETPEWSTPQDFFNDVNKEFGPFDLDVAADLASMNTKCANFCHKEGLYLDDSGWIISPAGGLSIPWHKHATRCWMNPPYGRGISAWVEKAYNESINGCLVVCLLPARTDTKWFHDFCKKGEIRFLRGRLKFGGAKHSAPFPSMVVIFRGKY